MSAATLSRSNANTPERSATDRFAARRAMAAAAADVSVCENHVLARAASEALAVRRRRESERVARD